MKPKVLLLKGDFGSKRHITKIIERTGFEVIDGRVDDISDALEELVDKRDSCHAVLCGLYLMKDGRRDSKGGIRVAQAAKNLGYPNVAIITGGGCDENMPDGVDYIGLPAETLEIKQKLIKVLFGIDNSKFRGDESKIKKLVEEHLRDLGIVKVLDLSCQNSSEVMGKFGEALQKELDDKTDPPKA